MTDIKYRAWDEYSKSFYYLTIKDSPMGHTGVEIETPQDLDLIAQPKLRLEQKLEWQQSSGLQDKDGKLIFTGDIIAHTDNPEVLKAEVYFDFGSFMTRDAHGRIGGQYIGGNTTLYDLVGDPLYEDEDIPESGWVIVGNIYERN